MKKGKIICKITIIICVFTCIVIYCMKSYCYAPIKMGISRREAFISYINGRGIIVSYDDYGEYYRKGLFKEYISVIGQSPVYETRECFRGNKFYVEGYFDEELSEYCDLNIFYATSWDIIYPIKRNYYFDYYKDKYRIFHPVLYIDQYDLNNGDYIEAVHTIPTINLWEAYFLVDTEKDYYLVAPVVREDISWEIVEEIPNVSYKNTVEKERVILKGDSPEAHFNDVILYNNDWNDKYEEFRNCFLVKGQKDNNIITIDSWYIIQPFERNYKSYIKFTNQSRSYFTEDDIKEGIYIE